MPRRQLFGRPVDARGTGQRRERFDEVEDDLDVAGILELRGEFGLKFRERLDVALQCSGTGAAAAGLPFAGRIPPEEHALAFRIVGSRRLMQHQQRMPIFGDDALPAVGVLTKTVLDRFGKGPIWRYDHKRFLLRERFSRKLIAVIGQLNA